MIDPFHFGHFFHIMKTAQKTAVSLRLILEESLIIFLQSKVPSAFLFLLEATRIADFCAFPFLGMVIICKGVCNGGDYLL